MRAVFPPGSYDERKSVQTLLPEGCDSTPYLKARMARAQKQLAQREDGSRQEAAQPAPPPPPPPPVARRKSPRKPHQQSRVRKKKSSSEETAGGFDFSAVDNALDEVADEDEGYDAGFESKSWHQRHRRARG
jgi:hypothetical protein